MRAATVAVQSLNAESDCAIELVGEVRTDPLIETRYIAYVASGTDCDAASQELSGRGAELGIAYLRRPNLGQLRALVADMIRSVETTTGCRVSMRGRPALDTTTSRWRVTYVASGDNCQEARQALRDLGNDLEIVFVG
jgi:hypothetical protein